MVRRWAGKRRDLGSNRLSFLFKSCGLSCNFVPHNETLKWLSSLPTLMQKSFWWWQCSDRYIISFSPHLHTLFPLPLPVPNKPYGYSVDVKHHVYLLTRWSVHRILGVHAWLQQGHPNNEVKCRVCIVKRSGHASTMKLTKNKSLLGSADFRHPAPTLKVSQKLWPPGCCRLTRKQCSAELMSRIRWLLLLLCCLMSSDVGWHIRDKLRPMREHGSMLFYVHGNHKAR